MNPLVLFQIAISALFRNKLRSFLTMLGVMIGVAAVIAMVGVGTGARQRVQDTFASMGSNLLIVRSSSVVRGGVSAGAGSMPTITWDDLEAIRTELPAVRYAAAVLRTGGQISFEQSNWFTQIHGSGPDYFAIQNWATVLGEPMTEADLTSGAQRVWMGTTVVEELFDFGVDPIGQIVRISNVPYTVAGVLASRGQSAFGMDLDDAIYLPHTTYIRRVASGFNQYIDGTIYVGAQSFDHMAQAEQEVTELLRERHRIAPGRPDDFTVRNLTELAQAQQEGAKTFTTLLASIAAVSLLVGGIGIMNIMLVSVTERTREIGLRMAVGATPFAILAQFLVESMMLSLLGGLCGAGIGVWIATKLGDAFGWTVALNPTLALFSIAFSAAIGVAFGLYPARKASKLDPIDALRFE